MTTNTPGNLLREAREKQGLAVADIAELLHLEVRIIKAIEHDDYDKIPAAIYVRGYLRNYAKALGVEDDYIVSLYNADSTLPPYEVLAEVKTPRQISSKDKPVKAFTYLVVILLVLLLLIWHKSNFYSADKMNNTDIDFDVVTHPKGWRFPVTELQSLDPLLNMPTETTGGDATPPYEEHTLISPIADTDEIIQVDNTPASLDTLDLYISENSWVEVYDASDAKIFMHLAKKGEEFHIQGATPFRLVLGYSPGVIVKFNNEVFDTEPYSKNSIARFQLPPKQ